MDVQQLTLFAELHARKKAIEEEAKSIAAEMAAIELALLTMWEAEGVESIKVIISGGGKRTCSIKRQLWAGPTLGNYSKACEALKESGDDVLANMVQERFNAQTISAWVRERLRDDDALPSIFRLAWEEESPEAPLTVIEKFNISVRKA